MIIDFEKGIHRYWLETANQRQADMIKEKFERGSITEKQLMIWSEECDPHALIELLMFYGLDGGFC
jgi:hypothetical protein